MRQMYFFAIETDQGVQRFSHVADSYLQAFTDIYSNPYDRRFNAYKKVERKILKVFDHQDGLWWPIPDDVGDK
jgi:hypothetical protein